MKRFRIVQKRDMTGFYYKVMVRFFLFWVDSEWFTKRRNKFFYLDDAVRELVNIQKMWSHKDRVVEEYWD